MELGLVSLEYLKSKFSLSLPAVSQFMRLDNAALHALSIFSQEEGQTGTVR
jgi:hypothetical protein